MNFFVLFFFIALSNATSISGITVDDLSIMSENTIVQWIQFDDGSVLDFLACNYDALPIEKQKFIREHLIYHNRFSLEAIFSDSQSAVLSGHGSSITALAFSDDCKFSATASCEDKLVLLWDLTQSPVTSKILDGNTDYISTVVFSSSGKFLFGVTGDKQVGYWNLASDSSEFEVIEDCNIKTSSIGFSADGNWAITGSYEGTISVWDLTDLPVKQKTIKAHTMPVQAVALSGDGRFAITGSSDKTAKLWDLIDDSCKFDEEIGYAADSVRFSADYEYALIGSGNSCNVWNLKDSSITALYFEQNINILASKLSNPEGLHRFVSFDSSIFFDCLSVAAKCWENQIRNALSIRSNIDILFSSDGKYACSKVLNQKLLVCHVAQKGFHTFMLSGHSAGISRVAFSNNEKYILTGSWDHTARLWNFHFSNLTFIQLIFAIKLLQVKRQLWMGVPEIIENENYLDALKDSWYRKQIERYFKISFSLEDDLKK